MLNDFPKTSAAIQQGIERSLHSGVQIYVSVNGNPVIDAGLGFATADHQITADTIMLWRSAGKPLTAAAICRQWQQGQISLDTPLSSYLSETQTATIGRITIRQILTHTAGIPLIDSGWPHAPWESIIAVISLIDGLSHNSAYQPQNTWFLLGEILRRMDANCRSFQQILTDDVLNPLGIQEAWCGLPTAAPQEFVNRLPQYSVRENGSVSGSRYDTEPWLTQPSPGGNLRGPVRELGRFYEMLLNGGRTSTGDEFLQPGTVAAMTTRHRAGLFDETFQHVVDFGLGLIIDSNHHGPATVPYGFGQFCSPATFGHGGAQCAMGFCDPVYGLVVAWAANGFCGEPRHQRRNKAINEAVYTDLGLATA